MIKKINPPRNFQPITDEQQILQLIHEFNGQKKHDDEVGARYGLSKFQTSVLRQVFGKTEFVTRWHSPELKDAVVAEYEDGMPTNEIAGKHGISIGAVYGILESRGVERGRRDFWKSKFKIKQLIDLRENRHMSWAEIGKMMGRTLKCCQAKYAHMKRIQTIVELHDVQGLGWDEIAARLGLTPKYCQVKYKKIKETGDV